MSKVWTAILIGALSAALIEAPVMAAPAPAAGPASAAASASAAATSSPSVPLGVVLQAENARVGLDLTASGETLYDGDRLQTPGDGTLRARLGGGQIYLRQDTEAELHAIASGFSAELEQGSVVASSAEGQSFRVIADGVTIRPASAQATTAQVTKISGTELVLTSTRGALEISLGEDVKTMAAGSSYRLVVQPADAGPPPAGAGAGSPPQQPPFHTGRNRFLLIAIPLIVAGAVIIAWRVWISPDAPK